MTYSYIVEGTIHRKKVRIILTYIGCSKEKKGENFEANREMQRRIERYMEVDPEVLLICLGDINGRLKALEPHIETDSNGKMVEEWTEKFSLHHLNQSEKCQGVYTFGKEGGKRSAIDHILVNNRLMENFKGMVVDENKEELNISDHNLVKAWFNIGGEIKSSWKKPSYETIQYYIKDVESMKEMEENLVQKI